MNMIFLVDGDNNIGTGLKGIDMLSEQDTVLIFYQKGTTPTKMQKLCEGSKANIQYIESVRDGKNSIDFQIITELGVLVGKREADFAYVISQDKGYAASIDALRARYANAFQEVALRPSIESCLHLSFILKSKTRQDLNNALVQEYGAIQARLLYQHLKKIFQSPDLAEEQASKKKAAEGTSLADSRNNSESKKAPEAPQAQSSTLRRRSRRRPKKNS